MRRLTLLTLLLFLTVNTAYAALNDVDLVFNDAPSHRVAPNTDKPTNIAFSYTPSGELTAPTVTLNAENLSSPPDAEYQDITVDLQQCSLASGTYQCTLTSQQDGPFYINHNESTTASFTLTATYQSGSQTHRATHSITVDNTPPKPTYVGPQHCQENDECYISPTETQVVAAFQDGTGPFNQQDVIAIHQHNAGEEAIRYADTGACQNSKCAANTTLTCQDGETTTFTLNTAYEPYPPTQDDAGNIIQNNTETTATCDAEPPSIESVTVTGSTQNVPTVENGGTITATVNDNLNEPLTVKAKTGDASTTTSCSASQGTYECTVQAPRVQSAGQQTITLRATDKAENTASQTIDVTYRNVTDRQSNVWTSTTSTSLTDNVNKDILSVEPRAYAKTEFTGSADATLRDLNIQQCQANPENSVSNVELDYVDESTNTAYLSYQLTSPGFNQTVDASTFTMTCNVSAISTDETTAYLGGEPETITATVPLSDGTRLSRSLQDEIKSTHQDIKDYNDGLNSLQQGIEMGQNVCRLGSTLEGVFGGISDTGLSLSSVPIIGDVIGEGVKAGEKGARTTFQQAWNEYAAPVCQILSCRTEPQREAINTLNTLNQNAIGDTFGEDSDVVDSLESFSSGNSSNTYTPFNSYLGTAASICIPAVLKHYKTIQATECSYLDCLTEGVQEVGFSPSQCRAQRSQAQCTYVTQNIANSIPVYNFLSSAADNIASIINDPVSLIGTAGTALFCQPGMPARAYFPCEIGSTAQSAQKIYDQYSSIRGAVDAYNALDQGPTKLCDQTLERTSIDSRFYRRQTADQASLNPEEYKPQLTVSEMGDNPPSSGENWVRLKDEPTYLWRFDESSTEFVSHNLATGNKESYNPEEIAQAQENIQKQAADALYVSWEESYDSAIETTEHIKDFGEKGAAVVFGEEADGLDYDFSFKRDAWRDDNLGTKVESFNQGYIDPRVTAGNSVTLVGKIPQSTLGVTYGEKTVRRTDNGKYKIGNQPPKPLGDLEGAARDVARDMEDRWDEVETANDKLFQARFNQRPGPDVTVEEAAEMREELSDVSRRKLSEVSALRSIASQFKPGIDSVGELPDIAGQTAAEHLAEGLEGVSASDVESWDKEKLREELKERNEGLSSTIQSATYNVTPTQAAFWNAGQLGQGILRSRSLGFNWKDEWGTSQFGEAMQDIASVPDTFANPHKVMCSRQGTGFGKDYQGDVSVNTEGRKRSIGAMVSATKNEFTTPDGSSNTTYVIGYKVQTDTSGLGFSVELRQPGNKDITSSIAGTETIQVTGSGQSYSAEGKQADTSIRLQEDYSQVCLNFDQNPRGYFDYTSFDGRSLCQEVRQ